MHVLTVVKKVIIMTTQEIVFEDVVETLGPLMEVLELGWKESTSIEDLVDLLKSMSTFAMRTNNLLMKRNVVSVMTGNYFKFIN